MQSGSINHNIWLWSTALNHLAAFAWKWVWKNWITKTIRPFKCKEAQHWVLSTKWNFQVKEDSESEREVPGKRVPQRSSHGWGRWPCLSQFKQNPWYTLGRNSGHHLGGQRSYSGADNGFREKRGFSNLQALKQPIAFSWCAEVAHWPFSIWNIPDGSWCKPSECFSFCPRCFALGFPGQLSLLTSAYHLNVHLLKKLSLITSLNFFSLLFLKYPIFALRTYHTLWVFTCSFFMLFPQRLMLPLIK